MYLQFENKYNTFDNPYFLAYSYKYSHDIFSNRNLLLCSFIIYFVHLNNIKSRDLDIFNRNIYIYINLIYKILDFIYRIMQWCINQKHSRLHYFSYVSCHEIYRKSRFTVNWILHTLRKDCCQKATNGRWLELDLN